MNRIPGSTRSILFGMLFAVVALGITWVLRTYVGGAFFAGPLGPLVVLLVLELIWGALILSRRR